MHGFRSAAGPWPLVESWWAGARLAGAQVRRQADWQRQALGWVEDPAPQRLGQAVAALREGVVGMLALPFDLWRLQHAAAVDAGLWPRSLLESRRFEAQLEAWEQWALGPLARRV